MEEKKIEETLALNMTRQEIIDTADALCQQQRDTNRPTGSGSYDDFIGTAKKGRELLVKQPAVAGR